MTRLVEELEYEIGKEISLLYWNIGTDHDEYDKILNAIYDGTNNCRDTIDVMRELHKAGFKIVKA
jgi:hypothetical protein